MNQDFVFDYIKHFNLIKFNFLLNVNLVRGWKIVGDIIYKDGFFIQKMIYINI